eukprot:CAMPEP_0184718388 /NCGR_PEP_ID=MMETSP0314-20130426/7602_1 /TAXON_ID=38298 /ORGANISM="Rhodella maculata, Strain CCMP 736" /LENGTH=36 /DNA_ID= /DNA_START= /DNA_END= /DNA_ORIENTATION=
MRICPNDQNVTQNKQPADSKLQLKLHEAGDWVLVSM